MLLTLDIGNSAVKGGLVAEGELTRVFSVAPPDPDPAD
jgi:pantothenate kinase type III